MSLDCPLQLGKEILLSTLHIDNTIVNHKIFNILEILPLITWTEHQVSVNHLLFILIEWQLFDQRELMEAIMHTGQSSQLTNLCYYLIRQSMMARDIRDFF